MTSDADLVPDGPALEAAAEARYEEFRARFPVRQGIYPWSECPDFVKDVHRASARVTIAAWLRAQPGYIPPPPPPCDHKHWDFARDGTHCTCGAPLIDFGD